MDQLKLRIIGNSHVACYKHAMLEGLIEVPKWVDWGVYPVAYGGGQRRPFSVIENGGVRILPSAIRNRIIKRHGTEWIGPEPSTIWGVCLVPDPVPEYSVQFMRQLIECGISIFAIMGPWPRRGSQEGFNTGPEARARAYDLIEPLGIHIFDALPWARDEEGYLKPEFERSLPDPNHANSEYGREVMAQIFDWLAEQQESREWTSKTTLQTIES